MLLSAVMSLEECLAIIRSGPVPPHEEAAKFQLIAPILRNLGWNPDDGAEFLLEYAVGGTGEKVDIALQSAGRLFALVEAKRPYTDLSQHVEQVLRYAFQEGVDICVLTTGLEWWLFLPREKVEWAKRRFAVLDLMNDSVDRLAEDLNAFLHKETLVSGQAETKAKLVLKASLDAARLEKELPKIWRTMLDEPDGELVDLIGSRVYEKLNLRPEKSQVIAALRGNPVPTVSAAATPATGASRAPSRRPVAFTLWGVRHPISMRKAIYAQVVDLLYERHAPEFSSLLEPIGRRKVPFAALDTDSFWDPHQVKSSQYFIETNGHTQTFDRWTVLLLEHFGYDESDLDVLFE